MYDVYSIAFYIIKKIWVHVWVHVNDIHTALEQLFQESPQAYNQINNRIHFYTHIDIATFMLFASGDRAKQSQCTDAKLRSEFIGMCSN